MYPAFFFFKQKTAYEMLILSDHGQVETTPFRSSNGKAFGEVLAELLPGFHVKEAQGGEYGPPDDKAVAHAVATLSGGTAHLYFTDEARRLSHREVNGRFPRLVDSLAGLPQVAMLMLRDGDEDVF